MVSVDFVIPRQIVGSSVWTGMFLVLDILRIVSWVVDAFSWMFGMVDTDFEIVWDFGSLV